MAFFNNIKVMTNTLTKTANNLASSIVSSISTMNKDLDSKKKIEKEINSIKTEIDAAYLEIGRKYVDFVIETQEMPGIDVSEILKMLDPKLTRKQELENELVEIEKRIQNMALLQEKSILEKEFFKEKEKFDKALAMNVMNQSEYDAKINLYRKRIDNFEELKRIEQQYDLGVITIEEKIAKTNAILNS